MDSRKSFHQEDSPGRYVLKIHFFIESGLKMIQFKIQFKTKSEIFIQKIFIQKSQEYSSELFIKKNVENYSKFQNKAKIWLWSPLEAPVYVIDPLK